MSSSKSVLIAIIIFSGIPSYAQNKTSTTSATFELNNSTVTMNVPFVGAPITNRENPLFKALSRTTGPEILNHAIFVEQNSFEQLKLGNPNGLQIYITVGSQSSTVGRADGYLFKKVKSGIESQMASIEKPTLSEAAKAASGLHVAEFRTLGIVRSDETSVGFVSATKYADNKNTIVRESTIGTLFFLVNDSILNVVVQNHDSSQEAIEETSRIVQAIEIDS